MLYVLVELKHTVVGPLIEPGVAGSGATVTDNVAGDEEPQELFAVTEIVPPLAPAVALILLVVDVPLHPPGNAQVYDVADGSLVTE